MEKKNTILLTVIAVATLLVAVVGATFAYFTASVTTTNDANKTTTVKTSTLASAVMDLGNQISPAEGAKIYPGYKALKTLTLTGSGDANANPVTGTLTLTPSVADFGSHIKYTVYKVATADAATKGVTCTASNPTTTVDGTTLKYVDNMTCTTTNAGTAVMTGTFSGTTAVTKDITVTSTTKDTYYVLIEYLNDDAADQNAEQGKTFSVTIGFTPKA